MIEEGPVVYLNTLDRDSPLTLEALSVAPFLLFLAIL